MPASTTTVTGRRTARAPGSSACSSAVMISQGSNEAFSTGSQAQ